MLCSSAPPGTTKPVIRRVGRRGGVKHISGPIYQEMCGALKIMLENIIRDTVTYTNYADRYLSLPSPL
jgi:histone H4